MCELVSVRVNVFIITQSCKCICKCEYECTGLCNVYVSIKVHNYVKV